VTPTNSYINKSVDRALRLLDLFDDSRVGLTANEIADLLGTTRVTIYPTLHTLHSRGYLSRDEQGRFILGMKIIERSGQKLAHLDIRRVAQQPMRELARHLKANAHLATLHGHEVLYLEREEGRPSVTLREIIGHRVSPHCTALGKCLLAFLPLDDRKLIVEDLNYIKHTPSTISTPQALLVELENVRRQGYSVEIEEFHLGSACIAGPIWNHDGKVIAAISVSMSVEDLRERGAEERAGVILETSQEISRHLGFQPPARLGDLRGGDA